MLSDEQLDVLSGALIPLYQWLERTVIADIARRIKESLELTRTAELRAEALRDLGYSPAEIRAEAMKILRADKDFQKKVEENTRESRKKVQESLKEVTGKAKKAGAEVVEGTGDITFEEDAKVWEEGGKPIRKDSSLDQIVDAMKEQTEGELTNLTNTTGFRTDTGIEAVRDVFQKELDKAIVKLTSGAYTKEECVREVIHELAKSGLRTIDYASGRSYQLDTAVRMCINTAANQLAAQVSDANIRKTGVTLVQVSAHWGARDKGEGIRNHKEWQGKIYSIDGMSHPEEEKRIRMEIRDLTESTGYSVQTSTGEVDGLHGVNCRHNHYPFFEGSSTPVIYDPEPEPKEINGKTYSYYAMTQGMRRREREIRALKREQEALQTLGEDTAPIKAKIRQKKKEYQDFCDSCGLRAQPNRLRVESGTTDLNKTEAWKEYKNISSTVDKSLDIGDIKGVMMKKNVKKVHISSKDLNEVTESISDLSKEYKLELDVVEIGEYTDDNHVDSPMFFRVSEVNGVMERKLVINNACAMWWDDDYKYQVLKSGYFAGDSIRDFTEHEMAHLMTFQGCRTMDEAVAIGNRIRPKYVKGVSSYSDAAEDGAETVAEAFVRLRKGKMLGEQENRLLKEYTEVWKK